MFCELASTTDGKQQESFLHSLTSNRAIVPNSFRHPRYRSNNRRGVTFAMHLLSRVTSYHVPSVRLCIGQWYSLSHKDNGLEISVLRLHSISNTESAIVERLDGCPSTGQPKSWRFTTALPTSTNWTALQMPSRILVINTA